MKYNLYLDGEKEPSLTFRVRSGQIVTIGEVDDFVYRHYVGSIQEMIDRYGIERGLMIFENPYAVFEVIREEGDPEGPGFGDDDDEDRSEVDKSYEVVKFDNDKRNVFGWAYVSHDRDGNVIVDKSGEFIDDVEELESAAYDFVLKSRQTDADHKSETVGTMVESIVFTPEKIEKMGIPQGVMPLGWWVGFHIDDDEVWKSVRNGDRRAFSIHGTGTRAKTED